MSPIARRQIRAIKVNKERTVILTVFYFTDSLLIWFRFLFLLFSLLSLSFILFLFFWAQAGYKSPWKRILLPLQRCANWWHIFVTQMFQNKNVPGPAIAKSGTKYDTMWHVWSAVPSNCWILISGLQLEDYNRKTHKVFSCTERVNKIWNVLWDCKIMKSIWTRLCAWVTRVPWQQS